jgi:DNA-binding MarR family transcriptional regulator
MSVLPEERFIDLLKQITEIPLTFLPDEIEISRSAVPLLMWVARTPGCGVLDIAKGLQLSPPTISVGIHRLVNDGWIERRKDPSDQRVRPLFLTSKGDAVVQQIRDHRKRVVRVFLAGLTPDEQQLFFSLMEKAVKAMVGAITAEDTRSGHS